MLGVLLTKAAEMPLLSQQTNLCSGSPFLAIAGIALASELRMKGWLIGTATRTLTCHNASLAR
jgi:hypothetical protein